MNLPDPLHDLRTAFLGESDASETAAVRIDVNRRKRTGAPEVIYAKGKSPEQIVTAALRLIESDGRAMATRVDRQQAHEAEAELQSQGIHSCFEPIGRTLLAWRGDKVLPLSGGRVGILTAGSSDRPQAAEAAAVLREMGCETSVIHDVGVAGLHRLVQPLETLMAFDPDALIVVAGMDGVLPGVVSGLVSIPIVGLPTSTGYGFGGEGLGALTTMLQACSPGIAVVNIDNGIGAGVMAGLIANRAAAQRSANS